MNEDLGAYKSSKQELSGILSSPGLCNDDSDVMNNFMNNLNRKLTTLSPQHQRDSEASPNRGSPAHLRTKSFAENKRSKLSNERNPLKSTGGLSPSPSNKQFKQSEFSESAHNDKNQQSQLGQFAQLSYLYNNWSEKLAKAGSSNDQSDLIRKELGSNSKGISDYNQLMSQLSQFGVNVKQHLQKSQSMGGSAEKKPAKKSSKKGDDLSFKKSEARKSQAPPQEGPLFKQVQNYEKILQKLTESQQVRETLEAKSGQALNLEDIQETTTKHPQRTELRPPRSASEEEEAAFSKLKKSQLFSQNDRKTNTSKSPDLKSSERARLAKWLQAGEDESPIAEDRFKRYSPKPLKQSEGAYDKKSYRDNESFRNLVKNSKLTEDGPAASEEDCDRYFQQMQGLMTEKGRLEQEQEKIRSNKFLKMVDRNNAMKSVRSLSKAIDEMISKEKEKISDHYNSKMSQGSAILARSQKEEGKATLPARAEGTVDSLAFSQSIALSNMAQTIKGAFNLTPNSHQIREEKRPLPPVEDLNSSQHNSQFIFSGISNLKENIGDQSRDESPLARLPEEDYPPRVPKEHFEEDLARSMKKRSQKQVAEVGTYIGEDLKREKEIATLKALNTQLEQKLALREKQLEVQEKKIELLQKSQQQYETDWKAALHQLETELELAHQQELERIKADHFQEMEALSRDLSVKQEQTLLEEVAPLKQENAELKEKLTKLVNETSEEQRLRPFPSKQEEAVLKENRILQMENRQLQEVIQEQAESSKREIEELTMEADEQHQHICELQDKLKKQEEQLGTKTEQVSLLNQRLAQSSSAPSAAASDQQIITLKQRVEGQQEQLRSKDSIIDQLKASIGQLEDGLSGISREAQVVAKRNLEYKKKMSSIKQQLKIHVSQSQQSDSRQQDALAGALAEQERAHGAIVDKLKEELNLEQNEVKELQRANDQLRGTVSAQQELVKQLEEDKVEAEQRIEQTNFARDELLQKLQDLRESQEGQESEIARQGLQLAEKATLVKEIDALKLNESKLKKKLLKLQAEINKNLLDQGELSKKYSHELEANKALSTEVEETKAELNKTELKLTELTLEKTASDKRHIAAVAKLKKEMKGVEQMVAAKQKQIDDQKESIALKITVAQDLQALLQQQKQDFMESKQKNEEEALKATRQVQDLRKQFDKEKQQLLKALWATQRDLEELSSRGTYVVPAENMPTIKQRSRKKSFSRILRQSIRSLSRSISGGSRSGSRSPYASKRRSSSKKKSSKAVLNPFSTKDIKKSSSKKRHMASADEDRFIRLEALPKAGSFVAPQLKGIKSIEPLPTSKQFMHGRSGSWDSRHSRSGSSVSSGSRRSRGRKLTQESKEDLINQFKNNHLKLLQQSQGILKNKSSTDSFPTGQQETTDRHLNLLKSFNSTLKKQAAQSRSASASSKAKSVASQKSEGSLEKLKTKSQLVADFNLEQAAILKQFKQQGANIPGQATLQAPPPLKNKILSTPTTNQKQQQEKPPPEESPSHHDEHLDLFNQWMEHQN